MSVFTMKTGKNGIGVVFLIFLAIAIYVSIRKGYTGLNAKIGNEYFFIEIADTVEKQEKGLSGRNKLDERH